MNLSLDKKHVFCHICNEWKYIGIDTYILFDENGDNKYDGIHCLKCDGNNELGALLGYRKDLEWMCQHGPD